VTNVTRSGLACSLFNSHTSYHAVELFLRKHVYLADLYVKRGCTVATICRVSADFNQALLDEDVCGD
jgi:hypothetical protein